MFDKWYEPYQKEMKNDELMKFFVEVRNSILKEGDTKTSHTVHLKSFNTSMLPKIMNK